jgi:hypothetical protein
MNKFDEKFYVRLTDGAVVEVTNIGIDENNIDSAGNLALSYEMVLTENPNNVSLDEVADEVNDTIMKLFKETLKLFDEEDIIDA